MIRKTLIFAVIFFVTSNSQPTWPGSKSTWNGFDKYDFTINSRIAYVVVPQTPKQELHWVLRARFPNWHVYMDTILLNKGVYIAYIDVTQFFGSPTAVTHWDSLYQFMIGKGMAKKVAIEGVSRGGLISYNWAKLNSDKVACMYLEAPVCDIKSWPGGKGNGVGSAGDWTRAQQAYGMNETELMAWNDNPIDKLEALAAAKIPIYHKISLSDQIVPPTENTLILVNRYIALGGPAVIDTQTIGPFDLQGHHFPISNPEKIASFIDSNLVLKNQSPTSIDLNLNQEKKPKLNLYISYEKIYGSTRLMIQKNSEFYSLTGSKIH